MAAWRSEIISQSAAAGTGATLTNAGRTLHQGLELATQLDMLDMVKGPNPNEDVLFKVNFTWVADAEFRGARNSNLGCISLTPAERANVNRWLASCTVIPERTNNHAWFTATNQAARASGTWTMRGLSTGRSFAAKTRLTASASSALAPSP